MSGAQSPKENAMHPSHKLIWIPSLVILAALAAVLVWAFSTSPRVYAEPDLASGPDSSAGWRIGEPVSYETLTVFPVLSSQEAYTADFETLDAALAKWRRIQPGNFQRPAGEPARACKSRQKTAAAAGRRSGFRRQARPHHRQGPHHSRRRPAAASRR